MSEIVYLDSCDFSDLSEPAHRLSEENRRILETIRAAANSGRARFVLSGIHLSEAVHATEHPAHKAAALRRAILMEELCSDNFLRLPHEVMSLEIAKALSGTREAKLSSEELFSGKSEWFGMNLSLEFGNKQRKAMAQFEERIAHLPRSERRRLRSDMSLTKRSGRAKWRELVRNDTSPLSNEFPFSLFSAKFVTEWIAGCVTDEEYSSRLYGIMNSPRGLVESVLDLTNERQTIYSLLRSEGEGMQKRIDEKLHEAVEKIGNLANTLPNFEFSKTFRQAIPKTEVRKTIISCYSDYDLNGFTDKEISEIISSCPAVSTFLEMYIAYYSSRYESTWQRMRAGHNSPKPRSASDFGDMMHAVYLPYCNLFRCDAYFSSLLRQNGAVRARVINRNGLHALSSIRQV
ncbi:hypothetical protein LPB73_10650 [Tardiphaga sp. 37S4]|uniref:hypothetical protein n=1 Tax=Tardiphaga sp. 37S4 TaxID=1404741 RepID=UPI001E31AA56|nr:hypothetical protein [Tardiphaga sp. 37S4]UFS77798.1 hypothetical protein LPB73_10650 [Tardiphaga sp. 37S4]